MDRPHHHRDNYRDHHRDRDNYRDQDRNFHHQPRRPSRFSDEPPPPPRHDLHRNNHHDGFSSVAPPPSDHRLNHRQGAASTFDSPPRHPSTAAPSGGYRPFNGGSLDESWPMRGCGGENGGGGSFRSEFPPQRPPLQHPPYNQPPQLPPLQHPPVNHQPMPQLSGQKRAFPFSGRGGGSSSPEHHDGRSFVKLFVGSVPRTATEAEIRPLFDEQGTVLEVAFIKDKRTGQQQGCCFIKYATSEEADRAIRALHNQYTLPGGAGPIQVRYADGERERIGNVEYKLFVGGMNKFATPKEVEEIFVSFGRVDDVYLMRDERNQSRGCGFVKYSNKESATAAVNALNGIYIMRGCDQPLTVRFADPKRPRAGEPRFDMSGPGSGPSPSPGIRPAPGPNFPDSKVGQGPPNPWQPWSPQNMGTSPNADIHDYSNQFPPRSGEAPNLSFPGGHNGAHGGFKEGSFVGSVSVSNTSRKNFDPSFPQVPPSGQQISPLQNPLESPQHSAPAFQLHQGPGSYSQAPTSQESTRPHGQPQTGAIGPYTQLFQSQQIQSLPGQLPRAQFQVQQNATSATGQPRPNTSSLMTNSQLPTRGPQQALPIQQSPSQLAQMLSQQTQTLQASFQSSQQAFSQLQQQVQMMQPSIQNQLPQQQSFQASNQQSQWAGAIPTTAVDSSHVAADAPPSTALSPYGTAGAAKIAPAKCNWTEHTSPDGLKYYYNSAAGESTWVKPEELTLYEQQQQQKTVVQQPQPQAQPNVQANPTEQVTQSQPSQLQAQFYSANFSQHPQMSSVYPAPQGPGIQVIQEKTYAQPLAPENSVNNPARFQQGFPGSQDWAWNNSRGK
ncbi:hypothetical protein RND81_14G089700 [Saponaria officinalis]|uniref:Flowering time control protein FCA n=1 Tax=Saponaria officinalis TaxID=3572 RepID=A0AAW1GQ33_SAPOF